MRTVYIEVFVADNFLMNYLLMFLASRIVCRRTGWGRIFLSAAAGCAYAVFAVGDNSELLGSLPMKIAVSVLMCVVAFGYKNLRTFMTEFFGMYIVTLFLGGGAFLAVYLFGGSVDLNGGLVIDSIAFRYVMLGTLFCALGVGWARNALRKINVKGELVRKIKIVSGGRSVIVSAFLDTGNGMTGLFGEPVILAEKQQVAWLMDGNAAKPIRRIPYRTAAGSGEVDAFAADEVVFLSGVQRSVSGVLIALYGGSLCADGSYSALLNPNILF